MTLRVGVGCVNKKTLVAELSFIDLAELRFVALHQQ